MPIKRSTIETGVINIYLREHFEIAVLYSDELVETSPLDLIWSSVGGVADYLFVGYFADQDFKKWYFANARRHEEMRQAIQEEIGEKLTYVYGQLWLDKVALDNGDAIHFFHLMLHQELPDEEEATQLFMSSIASEYLRKDFYISQV